MRTRHFSLLTIAVILLIASFCHAQVHSWVRTNPGGGGAFSTCGAGPTGIILAASDLSGVYMSNDNGASWTIIGASQGLTETHMSGLGFHPTNGNIFFIGTENGVFRTSNAGGSVSKVLSSGYVTDIELHQSGIGYLSRQSAWNSTTGAIYKTTDFGVTWSQSSINLPTGIHILKILIKPDNPEVVYLLTGKGRFACGEADVYRSLDGGVNWTNLTNSIMSVMDIEIDPHNFGNVYMTTMEADCSAQYYWTSLNGSLYKSTDGGTTWGSPLSNYTGIIFPDATNALTIRLIDPREPWAWNPKSGTFTSVNGGLTFSKTGDITTWDTFYNGSGSQFYCYSTSFNGIVMTLGKDLSNSQNIYWVNYQYIFKSDNNGTTFVNKFTNEVSTGKWLSRGFDNVNTQDIEINKSSPNTIYAAYFDIGLWRSLDHGNSWESCNPPSYTGNWDGHGGNTATVISDPIRSNVVWASMSGSQHGESPTYLVKSTSTGDKNSWQLSNTGLPLNDIMGLSIDINSSSTNRTLYVTANDDVYKSTNDGASWTLSYDCNGCKFTAVDALNGNLVYAGGKNGVFRSLDGGNSWTNISHSAMPSTGGTNFWDYGYNGVFDVVTDPNLTNVVYVVAHGTNKGLYKSTNQGTTWTKILTDRYLRRVAVVPQNSGAIYASSSSAYEAGGYNSLSKGVLMSLDNGVTWTQHNNGMAYPFANALAISTHPTLASVFVGAQGSGFQKSLLPSQVLALEENYFKAIKVEQNKVQLSWLGKNDAVGTTYRVMQSSDGIKFFEMHSTFKNTFQNEYTFQSKVNFNGTLYFKLVKVSNDGTSEESDIQSLIFNSKTTDFEIYPTLITDNERINVKTYLESVNLRFEAYTLLGSVVNLDVEKLNDYHYLLGCKNNNTTIIILIKDEKNRLLHSFSVYSD